MTKVERTNNMPDIKECEADITVGGPVRVTAGGNDDEPERLTISLPSALERMEEISIEVRRKEPAVFLDYDGTLTPIVERPEDAVLSNEARDLVAGLARRCAVAVISGRDLTDVRERVGLEGIYYAGSHGFDIAGPEGIRLESQQGEAFLPALDRAEKELLDRLSDIEGAQVERKRFSIAVHYRRVREPQERIVEKAVDEVGDLHPDLRKSGGKKVYELQPRIDWHKGKALLRLLERMNPDRPDAFPIYIGDDETDENAFKAVGERGIGIVVEERSRPTAAHYILKNPDEVLRFLKELTMVLKKG